MGVAKSMVGWREWVALPELGIDAIKVKVDTGARTSTLHTFRLESFETDGVAMVRFAVHPRQRRQDVVVEAVAPVHDIRWVSDSSGHRERRFVILTTVSLGGASWPIELTLTDRDPMLFRMLLGRTAIRGRYQVDVNHSYLQGKAPQRHTRRRDGTRG